MVNESKWEEHARLIALRKEGVREEPKIEEVTPEKLARRKFRENKPFIETRGMRFNCQSSKDTIIHFVNGIGDPNPLFRDEEYAKKTKYGGLIAPGSFLYSVQWTTMGGGLAGIHGWYVGGDWEWYRPILLNDEFRTVTVIREMVEKKGRMAGGSSIYIDYSEVIYINQAGEIVGKERCHTVWAGRREAGGAGKERGLSKPAFGREDWIKILDMYENEELKGSEPRYWEDVQVGDKVGPMIKGPLSVRDEIAWVIGAGSAFFRAHKLEYDYERKHPKALEYVQTEEADTPGDVPELVHILNPFARGIGVERAYDYGSQRMAWLCNLFTNWMGDDGFLWKMSSDERAFNQVGDVTTFEGKVTKKYIEQGKCCVDIEAWAKNQRDAWSMPPSTSTVILPSRQYGPVKYPDPAPELVEEVKRARPLDEMIAEGLI